MERNKENDDKKRERERKKERTHYESFAVYFIPQVRLSLSPSDCMYVTK